MSGGVCFCGLAPGNMATKRHRIGGDSLCIGHAVSRVTDTDFPDFPLLTLGQLFQTTELSHRYKFYFAVLVYKQ